MTAPEPTPDVTPASLRAHAEWLGDTKIDATVSEALRSAADQLEAEQRVDDIVPKCQMCGRARTLRDVNDYNPLQVITGSPLGWYTGDDGEVCPECMTALVGKANS